MKQLIKEMFFYNLTKTISSFASGKNSLLELYFNISYRPFISSNTLNLSRHDELLKIVFKLPEKKVLSFLNVLTKFMNVLN